MTDPAIREAADRACARIAPTWPLDRFIAVNPFWPLTHKPLPEVAGELYSLTGARLLMPRQWYAQEYRAGRLRAEHLREAIAESAADLTEDDLVALFWSGEPAPAQRPLVVDTMEAIHHSEHELTWREFVIERITRFCAGYFDDGQAQVSSVREGGFYASWRAQAVTDQAPGLFMGLRGFRTTVQRLPQSADEMLAVGCTDLGIPPNERERYFSAILLDINGWASWASYLRWTARIAGKDDEHLRELLAVRLGWEWILFSCSDDNIRTEWRLAIKSWPAIDRAARNVRSDDWLLQRAMEIAWLSKVRPALPEGFGAARPAAPTLQAAFCLDVRSEIFRRSLEAQSEGVQTIGIAGFFGVPIEYLPLAADDACPHLPGILAPKYRVTDTNVPESLQATRRARLDAAFAWKAYKSASLSSFAFVDSVGLFFAGRLFRDTFRSDRHRADHYNRTGLRPHEDTRRPRLTSRVDGTPITLEERCAIAESLLRTMGLTRDFARLVLLLGHGSETKNNAHAAGIDCGACGGQPGDVNARAAAALLNDEDVRTALVPRGIAIPATTLFVGGIHNTTTDDVTLFDEPPGSRTHQTDLADARGLLARASTATRRERAPRLGLADLDDAELHKAVIKRARNWAEVRPEWGLADNCAFIVAPRERTRHMNLEGRVFLHDYRSDEDPELRILEAIMLGPVVVGHWINFQYYASTVDNPHYGSGNKVLHNIVGGHIGVFEGNGGDLRIGLSLQSLHDGDKWVHTPLRLAVFIEAARDGIDRLLAKHGKVRELVDNEWIHLFQLDSADRAIYARRRGGWTAFGR